MYPPHLWTLSSPYVAVSKSYHVLRKVHIIPILVFFDTFLPLSRPSTQLNHLGPSHYTTCSHLPFRSNWSDGKAADLINTAYVPISTFLQPPFLPTPSLLLHPNSLRLLLHSNSLQTVPTSTFVSLGIDWIIFAEFLTSPSCSLPLPNCLSAVSPSSTPLSTSFVHLFSKPSLRYPTGTAAATQHQLR